MQTRRRGEETHREDQHDRQRRRPALVLCHQHEEHEEGGGAEDRDRGRALLLLLVRKVGPFERYAGRQGLLGELDETLHRRSGGHVRRGRTHDLRRGIEVVARHAVGGRLVLEGCDRYDRHHLAGRIAYLEPGDVLWRLPELLFALVQHLLYPAQLVEVDYVLR